MLFMSKLYPVERILDEKTRKRGSNVCTFYLIKWLGYPESKASWVRENDLNIGC